MAATCDCLTDTTSVKLYNFVDYSSTIIPPETSKFSTETSSSRSFSAAGTTTTSADDYWTIKNSVSSVITVTKLPQIEVEEEILSNDMNIFLSKKFQIQEPKNKPISQTFVKPVRKQFTSFLFKEIVKHRNNRS